MPIFPSICIIKLLSKMQPNTTTIRCPYIPDHVMHIDSLLTHLNRCKATNKHLYKNCLYNSLHVILKQNYQQHIQNCSDAAKFGEENQDASWEQKQKRQILQGCRSPWKKNYTDSDHSRQSYEEQLEKQYKGHLNRDQCYGYSKCNEYTEGNRTCSEQYDPIEVQYHSAIFDRDRDLSDLQQSSFDKKNDKIKNQDKVNTTENFSSRRPNDKNLNNNPVNLFKKPILALSQKDTLQDTQSLSKEKQTKNMDEDTQILMLLNQLDKKSKNINIQEQNYDQLGNELIQQVKIMQKGRNNLNQMTKILQ